MNFVKFSILLTFLSWVSLTSYAQLADSLTNQKKEASFILSDSLGWNHLHENQVVSFQVRTTSPDPAKFFIEGGADLNITFDSLGNFY